MSDFRMSYRAFDALLSKFDAAIERSALSKGHPPTVLSEYKLGYLYSFLTTEMSNLESSEQVKMYDLIQQRIALLNSKSLTQELNTTERKVNIA